MTSQQIKIELKYERRSDGRYFVTSDDVPGFRMVSVCVLVTPTVTLPKLTPDGMTEICGCTPLSLREIAAGELVPLLTTLMLPATAPAAVLGQVMGFTDRQMQPVPGRKICATSYCPKKVQR